MTQQCTLGAIRLLAVNAHHEHSTLDVVAGLANVAGGTISLGEAHDLVRHGQAVWVGGPPGQPLTFGSGQRTA
jgi:hypothetical protein